MNLLSKSPIIKSGWITFKAHTVAQRRSEMQVAICEVALKVLQDPTQKPQKDNRHTSTKMIN